MSITHVAFYPSDWLAGTRGMTAEEMGVFSTLIFRMYEIGGPVERNDDRLWRICGCKSKRAFVKVLDYLLDEGKIIEKDQKLFNERAQKEIEKVVEKSSKAKGSALRRWDKKDNKNNDGDDANADETHMPSQCYPEPEKRKKIKKEKNAEEDAETEELRSTIDQFEAEVWPHHWRQGDNDVAAMAEFEKLSVEERAECCRVMEVAKTQICKDQPNAGYRIGLARWISEKRFKSLVDAAKALEKNKAKVVASVMLERSAHADVFAACERIRGKEVPCNMDRYSFPKSLVEKARASL